jgi:quercetin dioxygenase-like cupin family protein
MILKQLENVPFADMSGYENVKKQVILGPADGSDEIVMRYFRVAPGGSTPYHAHDWPHLVKVEVGSGVTVDVDGNETPVEAGDFIYMPDNEKHQFRNTGETSFEFICIVPRRGAA